MSRPPFRNASGPRPTSNDEGPRPEDIENFSDATVVCPKCRTTLYDDVELCWKCGHALNAKPEDESKPPKWVIITVLVLLAVFVVPLIMRFI
jgi:hypothetical protein